MSGSDVMAYIGSWITGTDIKPPIRNLWNLTFGFWHTLSQRSIVGVPPPLSLLHDESGRRRGVLSGRSRGPLIPRNPAPSRWASSPRHTRRATTSPCRTRGTWGTIKAMVSAFALWEWSRHRDMETLSASLTLHYSDVIIGTIASQITSLIIVYSTVYSGADKKNLKAPRHWPLCGEFTGDRWIPRKKGQWRGKRFHLMTSSWCGRKPPIQWTPVTDEFPSQRVNNTEVWCFLTTLSPGQISPDFAKNIFTCIFLK